VRPRKRKYLRSKPAEGGFLFQTQPRFQRNALRKKILPHDQRDDAIRLQIAEGVISDRTRGFRGESLSPEFRVKPVADFQLFDLINPLEEEPAVTDQLLAGAENYCELRRLSEARGRKQTFQKTFRLFAIE